LLSEFGEILFWKVQTAPHVLKKATPSMYNPQPSIAEDTIYYALHPPESSSDRTSTTILALSVQNFVESLLPDFLWHRDTFQVKVVQNGDKSGWILEGWMRVGDSIDDEWCVVWLLREVSVKWDCAIR
jgi:hypothetical protein